MINITEAVVNATAPNQSAITNGWGLVKKKSFVKLNIAEDKTVIFGECKGSGASNYKTSADFINAENPVFRCTCPSRQFPCKHALGLMYAYVSGQAFQTEEVPADIIDKREKVEKREEKKKNPVEEKPKKVNKNALVKKMQMQIEGLELLEKVSYNMIQSGLGTMNAKTIKLLEDQAKQLGNFYVPGAQLALKELIFLFKNSSDYETIYTEAIDCLCGIYALCKKGIEYLTKRQEDIEMPQDIATGLEEWLGHTWQLAELKALGLVENDVELVQLSFNSYYSEVRQEFIDSGMWLNLKTGQIGEQRNYRPLKAVKYIKEEDTIQDILQISELFIYPGDSNRRIRWESKTTRAFHKDDFAAIKSHAYPSYQEVIKMVKNQIKNPLCSKNPVFLVGFTQVGCVNGEYVMEDEKGQRLVLTDIPDGINPESTRVLPFIKEGDLVNQVALVRFHNDMDQKRLFAQPLSIITDNQMIRLTY